MLKRCVLRCCLKVEAVEIARMSAGSWFHTYWAANHRVSVINVYYIHTKFHSNVNTFCGRMGGMADRETLRMALLGHIMAITRYDKIVLFHKFLAFDTKQNQIVQTTVNIRTSSNSNFITSLKIC